MRLGSSTLVVFICTCNLYDINREWWFHSVCMCMYMYLCCCVFYLVCFGMLLNMLYSVCQIYLTITAQLF